MITTPNVAREYGPGGLCPPQAVTGPYWASDAAARMRPRDSPASDASEAVARPLAASSAWNGAIVDYCFVRANGVACEHGKGSQQALHHHQHHHRHHRHGSTPGGITVEASYFYHTLASDHLPLVVDFNIVRSNSPTVQVSDEQGKLE